MRCFNGREEVLKADPLHPTGKATSTRIKVWPNKPGILPDYAQITVDFRHPNKETTLAMEADMKAAIEECCKRANVSAAITHTWEFGNEIFDDECAALVRSTAAELGVSCRDMVSQADHDAYNMTKIAPTALLFSPCKDGISHNESEDIELTYTTPAVNVLLHSVLARANR